MKPWAALKRLFVAEKVYDEETEIRSTLQMLDETCAACDRQITELREDIQESRQVLAAIVRMQIAQIGIRTKLEARLQEIERK